MILKRVNSSTIISSTKDNVITTFITTIIIIIITMIIIGHNVKLVYNHRVDNMDQQTDMMVRIKKNIAYGLLVLIIIIHTNLYILYITVKLSLN